MSTKSISLNLAHRNLLAALTRQYSGMNDLEMDETVHIADVSEALGLVEVEDLVGALDIDCKRGYVQANRELTRYRQEVSSSEIEGALAPEKMYEEIDTLEEALSRMNQSVNYKHLMETDPQEFEVQSGDLDWLMTVFTKHKWNTRLSRDQQTGKYEEVRVPLLPDEAIAVRSLRSVVKAALL